MFNFKKFFRLTKEHWSLVTTLTLDATTSSTHSRTSKPIVVYVHLFESNLGNRKMQIGATDASLDPVKLDSFVKSTDLYHTRVYRWLAGRPDPGIPRYAQVPEEDTVNMLKGSL